MIAALIRAIRTFAQTFVSMIAVGAAFSEIAWLRVLSVSGVAFVLSIMTSLATGLPEVEKNPSTSVLNAYTAKIYDAAAALWKKLEEDLWMKHGRGF